VKVLWELFSVFFKIGLFTFGGGYAMLSVITDNCVERRKWITQEDMLNITVIAETTPGPVAINCATFVGFRQAGVPGALAATFGVVLPSFLVIYGISVFLDGFLEIPWVGYAFRGIKLAVGLLICQAGINMRKTLDKNALSIVLLISSLGIMLLADLLSWNFSSIVLMLLCAAVSLAVWLVKGRKGEKA
jgi:chromate transporter